MDPMDFPDLIKWEDEATAVINDVRNHVKEIVISKKLVSNNSKIYLNITTIENRKICVRLSGTGFQVVGFDYDSETSEDAIPYETPYALLSAVSQGYVRSFGTNLTDALKKLL